MSISSRSQRAPPLLFSIAPNPAVPRTAFVQRDQCRPNEKIGMCCEMLDTQITPDVVSGLRLPSPQRSCPLFGAFKTGAWELKLITLQDIKKKGKEIVAICIASGSQPWFRCIPGTSPGPCYSCIPSSPGSARPVSVGVITSC